MIKGDYEILKGYENNDVTIGFGSYGQVKLAKNIKTGEIVAVKIIGKIAKNQVKMHNKLNHPKIIQLLGGHIDSEREITYMILEYADGGTLFEKIKMDHISKGQIRTYFRDVCEAVAYLHSQSIMHRDIKPQNILLTKKNQAKLCDFGFAALLGQRKTLCGTYQYMSPQMIQNRPYDYKIDIWALGILLFELISGHAPFRGDRPEDVLQKMKTKIYFCERFDQQEINLIKSILRVTPSKRPTVDQILQHPYFQQEKSEEKYQSEKGINTLSTTTEESKAKMVELYQLTESCNPKRMGQFQKIIEKQGQKQQQNSYPFYVPKNQQHKVGAGMTVTMPEAPSNINNQSVNLRTHSPINYKGTLSFGSHTTSPMQNQTGPIGVPYNPVNQGNSNKSFSGMVAYQSKVPSQPSQTITSFQNHHNFVMNPNKTFGFGNRFS